MTHAPSRRLVLGAALAVPAAAVSAASMSETVAAAVAAAAAAAAARPAGASALLLKLSPKRLERTLRGMVADGRAAGVSALVWQDGKERWFGAYGLADREANRPMARDTRARIWSMTKPVATVALMQLWDEARFRLEDPLSDYLPEYKAMQVHADNGQGPRPAQRPILVRDILRHTSGLTYDMGEAPADLAFRAAAPFEKAPDLAAFSRMVAALPLQHEPGTAWHYGTSTDIVARLV